MREARRYLGVALVAVVAAFVSGLLMHISMLPHTQDENSLRQTVNETLSLDPGQKQKVDHLDAQFAARRKMLDAKLGEANADLAHAILNEQTYGPGVGQAVDRSHHAMGELQKATLEYVFAIRAVLRPDQAARFDREIARTLTEHGSP